MAGICIVPSSPTLLFNAMWSISWKLEQGDILRLICDRSKCLGLADLLNRKLLTVTVITGLRDNQLSHSTLPSETQGFLLSFLKELSTL